MDNNVPEIVCRERLRIQEERFARDRERLAKGEEKIDTMEKAIIYLTEDAKRTEEELSDHGKRIETLEHRPSLLWDKVIFAIISAGVSLGVTTLFNIFLI